MDQVKRTDGCPQEIDQEGKRIGCGGESLSEMPRIFILTFRWPYESVVIQTLCVTENSDSVLFNENPNNQLLVQLASNQMWTGTLVRPPTSALVPISAGYWRFTELRRANFEKISSSRFIIAKWIIITDDHWSFQLESFSQVASQIKLGENCFRAKASKSYEHFSENNFVIVLTTVWLQWLCVWKSRCKSQWIPVIRQNRTKQ